MIFGKCKKCDNPAEGNYYGGTSSLCEEHLREKEKAKSWDKPVQPEKRKTQPSQSCPTCGGNGWIGSYFGGGRSCPSCR